MLFFSEKGENNAPILEVFEKLSELKALSRRGNYEPFSYRPVHVTEELEKALSVPGLYCAETEWVDSKKIMTAVQLLSAADTNEEEK